MKFSSEISIRQKKQGIHPNDYLSGNVKMHLRVSLLQTNICRHNHIGYDRNMNGRLFCATIKLV
ncbi:MAG: hypothetical protein ACLRTD_24480 [Bacteroides sp.]